MQTFDSISLLTELGQDVNGLIKSAEGLKVCTPYELNETPGMDKWSVAQILEHLNAYNRYYLPEMKKSMKGSAPFSVTFKPGIMGDYFTKLMNPKKYGKKQKNMKAPKDYSPSSDLNAEKVLEDFIKGEQELLFLLEQAKEVNIGKLKTPISISPFIKLKLGDTFRFLIAHQQRHFMQIQRTLSDTNVALSVL
ncbi:MAG: DinB family protein [Flavipsychrobacter sp.]